MVRRSFESMSLSIPFSDKQTDPIFVENVLEEVWDMVKTVRKKGGPAEQTYTVSWPKKGWTVDITVRRR